MPDLPGLRPVMRRRAGEMGPGFWRQLHEAAAKLDPELAARIDCCYKAENGSRDGGFTAKLFQNRIARHFQSSREILLD